MDPRPSLGPGFKYLQLPPRQAYSPECREGGYSQKLVCRTVYRAAPMLLEAAIGAVWHRKPYPKHIAAAYKDSPRWMQHARRDWAPTPSFAFSRASLAGESHLYPPLGCIRRQNGNPVVAIGVRL
jgi:hypothetical protein